MNVALDFKDYQSFYAHQARASLSQNPNLLNVDIEANFSLISRDSVLIVRSGSVNSNDAGLVTFLDPSDMMSIASVLPGANVSRWGDVTKTVAGNITGFQSGAFVFDVPSIKGDSGGAYTLHYGGGDYILGTQSATSQSNAYGAYLTYSDWEAINQHLSTSQSGDVTVSELHNLIVGGQSAEAIFGSFRADLILGRGGADVINDGDSTGAAWANDTVVGGAGDDSFVVGRGNDTIWGGDLGSLSEASDGTDMVDYGTSTKPITINYTNAGSTPTLTVKDGLGGTDSLYSIEKIIGTAGRDILNITGNIAAGTQLTVNANGGQAPNPRTTINANPAEAVSIDITGPNGTGYVRSMATGGQIDLVGFHTAIIGSEYDDVINDQSSGPKQIDGGLGNDLISADGSGAHLFGDEGDDTLTGGSGNDVIHGGQGLNVLNGGAGSDLLVADNGSFFSFFPEPGDTILGGASADQIINKSVGTFIAGGAGNDYIGERQGNFFAPGFIVSLNPGDGHDEMLFGIPHGPNNLQTTSFEGIRAMAEAGPPSTNFGLIDLSKMVKSDMRFIWQFESGQITEAVGTYLIDIAGTVVLGGSLTMLHQPSSTALTLSYIAGGAN